MGFSAPTERRSTSAAAGSATTIRQDQGATTPAEQTEPVVGEEVPEEPRPHSLERENEGDPGRADAPLRPDLDQVAQRALAKTPVTISSPGRTSRPTPP
jgi:hypothetical protein